MHFSDGAFWRPLSEVNPVMLQAQTGCSHNRCRFCNMYNDVAYSPSPHAEIIADLDEVARFGHDPRRVFLTGGNAFGLPQDQLVFTLEQIAEKLPTVTEVGCFARVDDVERKTDAELSELAALNMNDISIGAESGYDPALRFMHKGHRASDIVEQSARLDSAGIEYEFFYLAGMAGKDKCQEAVQATLEVFGQCNPTVIMEHTMTVFPDTELAELVRRGEFEPAGELEILHEIRTFVADYPRRVFFLGGHISNVAQTNGMIPDERDRLLRSIDFEIEYGSEARLQAYRRSLRSI